MRSTAIVNGVRAVVLSVLGLVALGLTTEARAFSLSSTAFPGDGQIPRAYTCDGSESAVTQHWADMSAGVSPPLAWQDPPAGTKAFALIVDDPDAPAGVWVHWVLYDIPSRTTSLPEGVAKTGTLSDGSKQGINDFRNPFYQGPCPPRGDPPHRYVFTLYALDAATDLAVAASKKQLLQSIQKHTLGKAELTGRYGH